ncbi:MAG TPA: YceI family protein, partial [Flavobacterium sp.]
DATVTTDGDNFENAQVEFTADVNSINTGNADRDNHLRSADFFNGETNGKMTFRSTSFTRNGDNYKILGELTLNGHTNPIELDAEFSGLMKDPWGNTKAGLNISGKINRKDYGINWNSALETGGVLVSDEVRLNLEIQLIKQT